MECLFFSEAELAREQEEIPAAGLAHAFIFGCGGLGGMMFDHLLERGIPVAGFVDNNRERWGKTVRDVPVVSPEEYAERHGERALILAASGGLAEIIRQCEAMGFSRAIPFYRVLKMLGILPYEAAMTPRELENDAGARAGMRLWRDEESRRNYRQMLRFHALQDFAERPEPVPGRYFSERFVPSRFLASFADGGAYVGDTYSEYIKATGNCFENYYGFEPDAKNFAFLEKAVDASDARIHLFRTGLGESPGKCMMSGSGDFSSRITADGDIPTAVDRLDSLLDDRPVTLIKLDVEGYEPFALRGMEKTLRRQRPALAVSVYHRIDHYWSLPLWIHGLDLGYRLRLAFHGTTYGDALCYAVPES